MFMIGIRLSRLLVGR